MGKRCYPCMADLPDSTSDAICLCRAIKLLSEDPGNYSDAPREGIRRILEEVTGSKHPREEPLDTSQIESIRMGTTVSWGPYGVCRSYCAPQPEVCPCFPPSWQGLRAWHGADVICRWPPMPCWSARGSAVPW